VANREAEENGWTLSLRGRGATTWDAKRVIFSAVIRLKLIP
jgi:hypothetical protein